MAEIGLGYLVPAIICIGYCAVYTCLMFIAAYKDESRTVSSISRWANILFWERLRRGNVPAIVQIGCVFLGPAMLLTGLYNLIERNAG
jgi:hypothetical protein